MAETADPKPKAPRKPRTPKTAAAASTPVAVKAKPVKKAATRKAAAPKAATAHKPRATKAKASAGSTAWKAQADQIKEQAAKTARSAADSAKGKTGSAMQGLAKLIADTAGTVDAKLGPQYGDYARYAAEAVAGSRHVVPEELVVGPAVVRVEPCLDPGHVADQTEQRDVRR